MAGCPFGVHTLGDHFFEAIGRSQIHPQARDLLCHIYPQRLCLYCATQVQYVENSPPICVQETALLPGYCPKHIGRQNQTASKPNWALGGVRCLWFPAQLSTNLLVHLFCHSPTVPGGSSALSRESPNHYWLQETLNHSRSLGYSVP